MLMVLCSGMSAFAGTIYFTGSDDAKPLVKASGDLNLETSSFLTSGTGKSTNLVTEFAEVNATSVAGMGTLTVILTEPSTSGWMYINLYTASGGEIQVGIGDNEIDSTISVYITIDGKVNNEVPGSDNAVGYRLSSDGSTWSIETTEDYGRTWIAGLSWDMASLPGGLTGDRVLDVLEIGAYGATAGYCQVSWSCADFDDLNAPNPSCAVEGEADVEAKVMAIMRDYFAAMKAGDADTILAFYSEDWEDHHGATKDSLRKRYQRMDDTGKDRDKGKEEGKGEEKGRSDDGGWDLSAANVAVDGDIVTVKPVTFASSKGSLSNAHKLKKEADGVWRLVYTEMINWEIIPLDAEGRKQLAADYASALDARNLRDRILRDPGRPGYHFVMPAGVASPFDPNGAIYWKGRYHLFYIFQDTRSGKKRDHWGHVSSTDLFHWRQHPLGLIDGMYSGNCFINKDGVPTICYHQLGQGNAMAVALDDDLNEWKKLDSNPITPKTQEGDEHHGKYRSWDPFGWLEGDTYYAIFGGERPGIVKSPTLGGEWQYVGDLFAQGVEGVTLDEDVSCPDLFKLGDKDVLLCISHGLGCRYYLGEWKNEQFYPESHAQMSWVDNSFFAPESLEDDKGRRIMWAWLLDAPEFGVRWEHGWSGTMSLPRVLSLGDDGQLRMDVPEEIEALRYGDFKKEDFALQSGTDLPIDGIGGNSLELIIDMESAQASQFGVKVCVSPDGQEETAIFYDAAEAKLKVDTRKSGPEGTPKTVEAAPLKLKNGERLKLRIFVDKSVVEVFANSRQAIMRRIYPSRGDSVGVSLFSTGGATKVHALEAWNIAASNPY